MEPWNNSFILCPPAHTFSGSKQSNQVKAKKNIIMLLSTCDGIKKILMKQAPLHQESALLSRFLYKYDRKFRNDIGYRFLKKLNTALRKYLALNFIKDVDHFISMLPTQSDDNYFPTKQMLEYVLVRLMTFSKIIMRICVCSKQASVYYLDRIKRGDRYWMSLMPYALLCRLWSINIILLQHSTQWYSMLHLFLDKLEAKGMPFLPMNFDLPLRLEDWLNIEDLDNFGKFEWSVKQQFSLDINFGDEDGDALENVILGFVKQVNEETQTVTSDNNFAHVKETIDPIEQIVFKNNNMNLTTSVMHVDKGEIISREKFMNNSSHFSDSVTSAASLKVFIDKEEMYRNNEDCKSLTKHLSFMQWQVLKTNLMALINPLNRNRKIERKFKKIWKEKCLDYC